MKRYLLFILILILGLVVGISEVLLPAYYAEQVESGLRKQVSRVEGLDVKISSRPALLLLTGRIQHGSVMAKEMRLQGAEVQDLQIEEVTASYKNLVIANTPEGVKAVAGTNTFFRAKFREADLNQYLNRRFQDFEQLKLDLKEDLATLALQVTLFNTKISLKIAGNFQVVDQQVIRFVPQDLELENVKIPSILLNQLAKQVEFEIKLQEYPLPLDLQEIRIEEGNLLVLGGTELAEKQNGVR